jgi:hypothetical protein
VPACAILGALLLLAFVALALSVGATWLSSPTRTRGVLFAPAAKECAGGSALGHAFSYCIYRARSGTQGGLVYHFHGREGDAHGWNDGCARGEVCVMNGSGPSF